VQLDPMKPKLKPPETKRLKPKSDIRLSKSAFKFNLRRYAEAATTFSAAKAHAEAVQRGLITQVTAASLQLRRLVGDPEALKECSLEDLRHLLGDIERGRAWHQSDKI